MVATQPILKTAYEFRLCTLDDLEWLLRSQHASHYELDAIDRDEVAYGLASGALEAYVLVGEHSKIGVTVRREGWRALLAAFYREGPPIGLLTEAMIGLEKVIDVLQADGIREVLIFVHRRNPQFSKLMRLYKRLKFTPDTVRLSRGI